jgi:hypothetical protein
VEAYRQCCSSPISTVSVTGNRVRLNDTRHFHILPLDVMQSSFACWRLLGSAIVAARSLEHNASAKNDIPGFRDPTCSKARLHHVTNTGKFLLSKLHYSVCLLSQLTLGASYVDCYIAHQTSCQVVNTSSYWWKEKVEVKLFLCLIKHYAMKTYS